MAKKAKNKKWKTLKPKTTTQLKDENDIIWKEAIHERDGHVCAVCGSLKALQAHHIIPREFKEFRHDIDNGILLCVIHHKWGKFSAHLNGLWFNLWLKENRPWQYEYILQKLYSLEFNEADYKNPMFVTESTDRKDSPTPPKAEDPRLPVEGASDEIGENASNSFNASIPFPEF